MPDSEAYLTEVIYSGRNKIYGGFQLRKNYRKNLLKAVIAANLIFAALCLAMFWALQHLPEPVAYYQMVDYKTTDFSLEEVKIPRIEQKKKPGKAPVQNQNIDAPPVVKEEVAKPQPIEKAKTDSKVSTDDQTEQIGENGDKKEETLKSVSSDTTGTNLYSEEIFMKVEIPAEFPGGPAAFGRFIGENIQYPDYAKKNKVDGIVYIHMIVNNDGSLADVKVQRGIEETCNNEVLRLIKSSPKWIPARQKGKFVRQRMIIPIHFKSP